MSESYNKVDSGVIGRVEAGYAQVTRQSNGAPTRINFRHTFQRVPHVQITPDLGANPNSAFNQFWIYLLSDGGPRVDKDGFNVGVLIEGGPGHSVSFHWLATEINPI